MNKKALLAEFIATFVLVFVGVGATASNALTQGNLGLLGIALAYGLTIAAMVSATAAVSGGHLNPAVTIGLFFVKKIDAVNAIGYIIVQCLGAIAGVFILQQCFPMTYLTTIHMGTPSLAAGVTPGMGLLAEIILTFILMFVIFGTAVDKRAPQVGGLFIGLAITLDILMGGPLTGACMNPARYLGPALLGGGLQDIWLYWLGPVLGAIIAAVTYDKFLAKK